MHIEEKLDLLKKDLFPDDLVIRFNEFKSIMKKIESKFLSAKDLNYPNSKWKERLKGFEKFDLTINKFELLDSKLDKGKKYWWVFLEQPDYEGSRHRIFDATLKGGKQLSYLFQLSPIFVIDKKYDWMIMIDEPNSIIMEKRIQ
jgi:hypothetical protein